MKKIIKAVHEAMEEHFINLLIQQFRHHLFLIKLKEFGVDIKESAGIDNWNTVVDLIGFPKDSSLEQIDTIEESFTRKAMFNNYVNTLNKIPINNSLCITSEGSLTIDDSFDMEVTRFVIAKHIEWLFRQYENYLELQDY